MAGADAIETSRARPSASTAPSRPANRGAPPGAKPLSPAANRQGILAMLVAMFAFIGSDTLMKIVAAALPPGQIMAVRGLFASLMTLGLVAALGETRRMRGLWSPLVVGRSALEGLTAFLFITALAQLPLAEMTAILQATPMILALLSVAIGLETLGWRRWSAIAVGFAGVILVVKPSAAGLNPYAGLALACAFVVAGRDLLTRYISLDVPSVVVALSTTVAVALSGVMIGLTETWRPLAAPDGAMLLGAALCLTVANLAIILSFRIGEPSVVSPFRYSIVVFSIALGVLVFGEWPDLASIAGAALILASGLYTLHREGSRRGAGPPAIAEEA